MTTTYTGLIDIGETGRAHVAIDDLDSPRWLGRTSTASRPPWPAGEATAITLLDGSRAGQSAVGYVPGNNRRGGAPVAVAIYGVTAFAARAEEEGDRIVGSSTA